MSREGMIGEPKFGETRGTLEQLVSGARTSGQLGPGKVGTVPRDSDFSCLCVFSVISTLDISSFLMLLLPPVS